MHKNTFYLLLITILSMLIPSYFIYGGYDLQVTLLSVSELFMIGAIVLSIINIKTNISVSKIIRRINILIINLFAISGVIFALICFYSLPIEQPLDIAPLAASIFFFSSMVASSSIFFFSSKVRLKNEEYV